MDGPLVYSRMLRKYVDTLNPLTSFRVQQLLDKGADPDYVDSDQRDSTLTAAARRGYVHAVYTMLEPQYRRSLSLREYNEAVFLCLVDADLVDYTDKELCEIYDRHQPPTSLHDELFERCIYRDRFVFARHLVTRHHMFHVSGLFEDCMTTPCSYTLSLMSLLIEEGYDKTGAPHKAYKTMTALETASFHMTEHGQFMSMLVPFAEVTLTAIRYIATTKWAYHVLRLMQRHRLRDLPDGHRKDPFGEPSLNVITDALRCLVRGIGCPITEVLMCYEIVPPLFCATDEFLLASKASLGPYSAQMTRNHVELLVVALLKQDAKPCALMRYFPALHGAMQPWNEERNYVYFGQLFRQRAFVFILAEFMSSCDRLPYELRIRIVQFLR